jgi:hypothetical protein
VTKEQFLARLRGLVDAPIGIVRAKYAEVVRAKYANESIQSRDRRLDQTRGSMIAEILADDLDKLLAVA